MGFIDYVAEYFRGPAGADGAAGPEGPAGPGQIHDASGGTFFETASADKLPGDYHVSLVLPEGAYLLSAWADATGGGENPTYNLPSGTTVSVAQGVDNRHYTLTLTLTETVPGTGPDIVVNSRVLYYLPA